MPIQEQTWLFWAQSARGFGAQLSVVVALYIAMQVHSYTRRRDKLEFLRQRWQEQQLINLATLSNPDLLKLSEAVAYGRMPDESSELSKKYYYLFPIINQIQYHYLAYQFVMAISRRHKRLRLALLFGHAEPPIPIAPHELPPQKWCLMARIT